MISSLDALIEAVHSAVDQLQASIPGGPGMPFMGGGGEDPLSKCKERIKIGRLDEGYVVTHAKPIDKKKIEEVLKDGDIVAKKADLLDTVISGVFETVGRGVAGPTEVYGFDTVDEVVEFVREACDRSE